MLNTFLAWFMNRIYKLIMNMKTLSLSLLITVLFMACKNHAPATADNEQIEFQQIKENEDYHSYLNNVIKLEQKYAKAGFEDISIPIRFYEVQPLEGASLYETDTEPIIEHLNAQFKAAHIQFYLDAPLENIYSELSVDHLYTNRRLEFAFTEDHYRADVLNVYIIKNTQDVLGFTHYPHTEIQRVFVAQKDLMGASFIHELGHFFGLLHTFDELGDPTVAMGCEFAGDKICDTPKDMPGASFIEGECRLYGTYKDEKGEVISPSLNNFMSYYGTCRNTFTDIQLKRMNFIAKRIKLPQMQVGI
jgi:hypothetical protein